MIRRALDSLVSRFLPRLALVPLPLHPAVTMYDLHGRLLCKVDGKAVAVVGSDRCRHHGGYLPRGISLASNGTGEPEPVDSPNFDMRIGEEGDIDEFNRAMFEKASQEAADVVERLERDDDNVQGLCDECPTCYTVVQSGPRSRLVGVLLVYVIGSTKQLDKRFVFCGQRCLEAWLRLPGLTLGTEAS